MFNIAADTLIYGAWLFMASLGLTLIFGVLRVLNFAHGSFYAVGAYAAASVVTYLSTYEVSGVWYIVGLFAAALVGSVILGPVIERLVLKWFYGRSEVTFLFVTYALFLIIESITQAVWGVRPYYAIEPYETFGIVDLGSFQYVGYDFFLVGVALVLGLFTNWLMKHTTLGHLTVSVIQNPEVSESLGINVARIKIIMFSLGISYAMLAGALTAPTVPVQPGLSINIVIACFAVVVIGGLGSIPGAALGALIVAFARTVAVYTSPGLELFSIYACMTLVLLAKPEGLFPQTTARRI